ncbi:MAG: hypothetical protein JRI68_12600 [Deltaproteobacteria bacterium]|nr:hypothetical protein [Deltaproteobacteria bacterium]
MTRTPALALISTLVVAMIGCSTTTPTADVSAPMDRTEPAQPGAAGPAAECPAVTDACMNADNHADCLSTAKQCPGHVVQLESCPLQFDCGEET